MTIEIIRPSSREDWLNTRKIEEIVREEAFNFVGWGWSEEEIGDV